MVKSAFIGKRNRAANQILYRRLLSKARRTRLIQRRTREKLNAYFEEIVNSFSIDYGNKEIQDIKAAVLELLNRITAKINERGLFKIVRIQPCGSMAEKASLWKTCIFLATGKLELLNFIEFDFLAVLEAPANCRIVESCSGCMTVSRYPYHWMIQFIFDEELKAALVSSCDCFSFVKQEDGYFDFSKQRETGCANCTISVPTGRLRIERSDWVCPGGGTDCSLMFTWTSKFMNLFAPDKRTLQKTQLLESLRISIDFLPALELFKTDLKTDQKLEHSCFIVPKSCPYSSNNEIILKIFCKPNYNREALAHSWRISHCLAEVDHFINTISNTHLKCYKVLKYLCQLQLSTSYHIKTAVLKHSSNCSDSSEDCAKCVIEILWELRDAYKGGVLTAFDGQANLIGNLRRFETWDKAINFMLTLMSKFKSRKPLEQKYSQKYMKPGYLEEVRRLENEIV